MSHIFYHTNENPVTPLVNIFQLISLPFLSFGVITPFCMVTGHGVLMSFAIGWASGLAALIAFITVVQLIYKIRSVREAQMHTRTPVSDWLQDAQADRDELLFAAWDIDTIADRIGARCA
jgi:hypothetical protein